MPEEPQTIVLKATLEPVPRLVQLAARVRVGDPVDWGAEANAMALEQAENDRKWVEQLGQHWDEQHKLWHGAYNETGGDQGSI